MGSLYPTLRAGPHLLLLRLSPRRDVIEKDIDRWVRQAFWKHPEWRQQPRWRNLVRLLQRRPEYRSLFYNRIRRDRRRFVRALLWLAELSYRPMESLLLFTRDIGPGLFINHGICTLIGAERIGKNCWINHDVSIGFAARTGAPRIGDRVTVSTGAKILGDITIGDDVMIGANAVVLRDVPSDCTVVGVPARIVRRKGERVDEPL